MTLATSDVLARFPLLFPFRNSCELRGPRRHSYFGPRTSGGSENQCHRSERVLNQGFPRNPSPSHPGGTLIRANPRTMSSQRACVCLLLQDLLQSVVITIYDRILNGTLNRIHFTLLYHLSLPGMFSNFHCRLTGSCNKIPHYNRHDLTSFSGSWNYPEKYRRKRTGFGFFLGQSLFTTVVRGFFMC